MTISAKSLARQSGIRMAFIADIAIIIVPGPFRLKTRKIARMDSWIGTAKAVVIAMTTASSACRRVRLMA